MNTKYKIFKLIKAVSLLILAFVFVAFTSSTTTNKDALVNDETQHISYQEYLVAVENKEITTVYFDEESDLIYVKYADETYCATDNPQYDTFRKDMLTLGVTFGTFDDLGLNKEETNDTPFIVTIIHVIVVSMAVINLIGAIVGLTHNDYSTKMEQAVGGPSKQNNVAENKSNSRKMATMKTFKDVAGLHEVKKDVQCLVDFIKNKQKYLQAGAELPKGVIFYGPPGTGKTLLAKAIAGEANVPFLYMSGSDFTEMYVGVGAKRVRELFEVARKSAPCIIFIDELDSIGCRRGAHDINGEDRKTLNALLTEMDGFKTSDNILVIGATNRIDDLDEALLRPGRFTNKFCIPLPETVNERIEILKLYLKNKKIAEDVVVEEVASETAGFSPAALEALLNEAAIISVQDKKRFIDRDSIDKAMYKIATAGHIKEDQTNRDKKELEIVAWHEAGHALVGKLNGKNITKVTILASTSGVGGATFSVPARDSMMSLHNLKNEVKELYAGRAAELLLMNSDKERVTTGAFNDIERATEIIKNVVGSYGMNEKYGMLNMSRLKVKHESLLEQEVEMAKELENETIELLKTHYDKLETIANMLLTNNTL